MSELEEFNADNIRKLRIGKTNKEVIRYIQHMAHESNYYYTYLSEDQVKWLESLGFEVDWYSDPKQYKISW